MVSSKAAPMSVREAVKMISSANALLRSTSPESPHFAKYACTGRLHARQYMALHPHILTTFA